MRLGCCGSMIIPESDPIGIAAIEDMARMGFDYVELALGAMMELPEAAFGELTRRLAGSGLACDACGNFFPRRIRLTGADVELSAALEYAKGALDRAASVGARIVVFGCPGAKNVPPGFDGGVAWRQLVELLRHLGPLAQERGLTIAIEPINRKEGNIVILAAEGLKLLRAVNHPHVQLLIDYYHLMMEREDPQVVVQAGAAVCHMHVGQVEGRGLPTQPDAELRRFFEYVRQSGYRGRCSVEGYSTDFAADGPPALRTLRELTEGL